MSSFNELLAKDCMPLGKYKGQKINHVCQIDRPYIIWLAANNQNVLLKQKLNDSLKNVPATPINKSPCNHLGIIGQGIRFTGRCVFISRPFTPNIRNGKPHPQARLITLQDDLGFSVTFLYKNDLIKGKSYSVRGIVKKHSIYKNFNQTIITLSHIVGV